MIALNIYRWNKEEDSIKIVVEEDLVRYGKKYEE